MSTKNKTIVIVVAVLLAVVVGLSGYVIGKKLTVDAEKKKADTAKLEAVKKAVADTKLEVNKNNTGATAARPPHEQTPPKTGTETTCNTDELSLAITNGDAAAGTFTYNIVLTNTGKRTCELGGYPGVSLVNANGNQIGNPADRTTDKPIVKVTLTPGKQVKSVMSVTDEGNFPDGTCKDGATKLRVYAPNDTGYLSAATTVTAWCPGFKVSPVVAL